MSSGVNVTSIKTGAVIILLFWAISECFYNEKSGKDSGDLWKDPTFATFVCLGDLTLLLWLWGVSLSVWRRAGIDFLELLSLHKTDLAAVCRLCPPGDYTSQVAINAVFGGVTDLSLIYLVSFVLFNKILRGFFGEPSPAAAHAIPSCLLLFYVFRFFSPYSSRKTWLRMLWKVVAAPYYSVKFRDGYIGDLLTSLVRVSISLSFSVIYLFVEIYSWFANDLEEVENVQSTPWWQRSYLYRFQLVPFLTVLPLWLRFMQCLRRSLETGQRWPHTYNALKYACALMVFSFGVLHPELQQDELWILCLCLATCYQFCWDVTMDWGLVRVDYNKNSFGGRLSFRRELSLGSPWLYYSIIAGNFILRFAWAITYVPREIHKFSPVYSYVYNNFQTVMAAAEIIRRMVWGFLRLEWEHIEKTGSVPVSLKQQRGLALDAGAINFSERVKGTGDEKFDISYELGSGVEMNKMNIESGLDGRSVLPSFDRYERIEKHVIDDDFPSSQRDSEKMSSTVLDMNNDTEDELYWLLPWLPFNISAVFPFFCFDGLEKSIAGYPERRFHARVLEVTSLTVFVLFVMSISALTKMHSSGYI